jgi:hypothetical protein
MRWRSVVVFALLSRFLSRLQNFARIPSSLRHRLENGGPLKLNDGPWPEFAM